MRLGGCRRPLGRPGSAGIGSHCDGRARRGAFGAPMPASTCERAGSEPPGAWAGACPCSDLARAPVPQGIDLKAGGRNKTVHRTAPKSENPYVKLLVKVRSGWGLPRGAMQAWGARTAVPQCPSSLLGEHGGPALPSCRSTRRAMDLGCRGRRGGGCSRPAAARGRRHGGGTAPAAARGAPTCLQPVWSWRRRWEAALQQTCRKPAGAAPKQPALEHGVDSWCSGQVAGGGSSCVRARAQPGGMAAWQPTRQLAALRACGSSCMLAWRQPAAMHAAAAGAWALAAPAAVAWAPCRVVPALACARLTACTALAALLYRSCTASWCAAPRATSTRSVGAGGGRLVCSSGCCFVLGAAVDAGCSLQRAAWRAAHPMDARRCAGTSSGRRWAQQAGGGRRAQHQRGTAQQRQRQQVGRWMQQQQRTQQRSSGAACSGRGSGVLLRALPQRQLGRSGPAAAAAQPRGQSGWAGRRTLCRLPARAALTQSAFLSIAAYHLAAGGAAPPVHVQDQPPAAVALQACQVHGGQGGCSLFCYYNKTFLLVLL